MGEPDRECLIPHVERILPFVLLAVVTLAVFIYSPSLRSAVTAQSAQRTASQSPQQKIVGRDCRQCHQVIVNAFALDTHGKAGKFLNDSRASVCETCHTNAEKHAETSVRCMDFDPTCRKKNYEEKKPPAEHADSPTRDQWTATQINESCLQCHSADRTHFNWKGSKHDRSDISCLSCHDIHHVNMMKRFGATLTDKSGPELAELVNGRLPEKDLINFTVEDTCLRCHSDVRKALFQRSTHLFRTENWTDGRLIRRNGETVGMKVTCTSCHDAHGGEGRNMLAAHSTNEVCYACHAEKRGPLLWEHPPVQENCLTCHNSHGSNNVQLLTRRPHQLCQTCHINLLPRHQTAAGFDIFTFNRSCMNCHTNIHGSNHPSGRAFTR